MNTCLKLDRVGMSYPGLPVLSPLDLDFPRGMITSVVGPSGCGKSTLLKISGGLITPSEGRVIYQGNEITGKPQGFGLMNQKDLLLPWLPLWKNVGLPLKIQGLSWKSAAERVDKLLMEFGLGDFREYYPHQLSGGMRQRGAFIRAYLSNPQVLLLDEPFAALDALTRKDLQYWLHEAWRTHGSSIILVTHSLEEALVLSHRVVVLTGIPGEIQAIHDLDFAAEDLRSKTMHPSYLKEYQELEASLFAGSRLDPHRELRV